jgi:hypothetical protein
VHRLTTVVDVTDDPSPWSCVHWVVVVVGVVVDVVDDVVVVGATVVVVEDCVVVVTFRLSPVVESPCSRRLAL